MKKLFKRRRYSHTKRSLKTGKSHLIHDFFHFLSSEKLQTNGKSKINEVKNKMLKFLSNNFRRQSQITEKNFKFNEYRSPRVYL